jgi:hypothetical protein
MRDPSRSLRPAPRTAALAAPPTVVALMLVALTGCASGSGGDRPDATKASPSAVVSSSTPAPSAPAPQALGDLARRGVATSFTGTYALDSTDPKQPDATVTIARLDTSFRVEIVSKDSRALLVTDRRGLVSCQLAGPKHTCLLVAKPGGDPPKVFDPGVQRLVTSDLEVFAAASGLQVTSAAALPGEGQLPGAQCFTVAGKNVDNGEYCLTGEGLLRRAKFPSGTLTLTAVGDEPTPKDFAAPLTPMPLPR